MDRPQIIYTHLTRPLERILCSKIGVLTHVPSKKNIKDLRKAEGKGRNSSIYTGPAAFVNIFKLIKAICYYERMIFSFFQHNMQILVCNNNTVIEYWEIQKRMKRN